MHKPDPLSEIRRLENERNTSNARNADPYKNDPPHLKRIRILEAASGLHEGYYTVGNQWYRC